MPKFALMVCVGASAGALLRWWLSMRYNAAFAPLPPGTLVANLIGAYVVGVAVALFAYYPGIALQWRLLVVTGFCGGLTTFSTFSAELVLLLQAGRPGWALIGAGAHLLGSLLMTFAGIGTVAWARS